MKLISMISFVLEQKENMISKLEEAGSTSEDYKKVYDFARLVINYAKFLKQPLTLGMFVPCDEKGNVLEEPKFKDSKYIDNKLSGFKIEIFDNDLKNHNDATMRVLFKGFVWDGNCAINKEKLIYIDEETCLLNENIEAYVSNKLELTESAIKQIGL